MVDTPPEMGLILAVAMQVASMRNRDGAKLALAKLAGLFPQLTLIWADGGYAGKLVAWAREFGKWTLEIVKRSDDIKGFVALPRRWVVERTFGWLDRCRWPSKDYEWQTPSSEMMIYIAMISLMLHRLAPEPA